jgi:AcrR family transcriptional regulator
MMLNMRSAGDLDDRTAQARIRDAALVRFAADGVAATSVRAIAADADVSPALVIHHFGSKDALRHACDKYVAAVTRERKREAMLAGSTFDPVAALRDHNDSGPLLRYLARTLVDGSPHVAELVDELVADAAAYMAEGVAAGTLRPTAHGYGRAAVLTLWSLGALVLHEHIERLLGVDLTAELDVRTAAAYVLPALDVLGHGVMTEEWTAQIQAAFADGDAATTGKTDEKEPGS